MRYQSTRNRCFTDLLSSRYSLVTVWVGMSVVLSFSSFLFVENVCEGFYRNNPCLRLVLRITRRG